VYLLKGLPLAAGAAVLALGQPAMAQDRLSEGQVSLYSEMWALAGVCLQYGGYEVRQDDLADFLNNRLDGVAEEDQQQVAATKEERLQSIRDEIERLLALPQGNRRAREVEANAASLMTRCARLASHDTAGEFFQRTS